MDTQKEESLSLDLETVDVQLAKLPPEPVFKKCGSCGRAYTKSRWLKLRFRGIQVLEGAESLVLRDCKYCKSTLAVHVSDEVRS